MNVSTFVYCYKFCINLLFSILQFKYAKITSPQNGNVKKGVIFSTYSALIGESSQSGGNKYKTRLKQLLQWCGEDFDGPVRLNCLILIHIIIVQI